MTDHVASCAPMLRWRGWRPPFLNHESWEQADDLAFVLEREGDLVLLPCSSRPPSNVRAPGDTADVHNAMLSLQELTAEGWHVVGRLHTSFVGQDAEDHFWEATLRSLGLDESAHPYASELFWEGVL